MKDIPYHSCPRTEVNSLAFSASPTQLQGQEAKQIHYPSQGNPPPPSAHEGNSAFFVWI